MRNIFFLFLCLVSASNSIIAIPCSVLIPSTTFDVSDNSTIKIRSLMIDANVANNGFTLSQYYHNFSKDIEWDNTQKNTVFNLIPETGLRLNSDVIYTPIEFSLSWLNGSVQYRQLNAVYAPKDLFDLALFGNDLNRQYDISNLKYHRLNYYDIAIGISCTVINCPDEETESNPQLIRQLKTAFKFHWLKGTSVNQTDSSFGSVFTTPDIFLGQLKLFQSIAKGGNNFALDIGVITKLQPTLTLGLSILNLNYGFVWNGQPQQKVLEFKVDSFSLQRYVEAGSIDSFYHKTDSITSNTSFKTSLPAQFIFYTSYPIYQISNETNHPVDIVTVSTWYRQYLSDNQFIIDFKKSLSVSLYLNLSQFFSTGHSFTTNFDKEFIIGHSFCFFVKQFNANLLIFQKNGYLAKSKGAGFNFHLGYSL